MIIGVDNGAVPIDDSSQLTVSSTMSSQKNKSNMLLDPTVGSGHWKSNGSRHHWIKIKIPANQLK
jgi:hypothetical protein